jgi:hypothetical protein
MECLPISRWRVEVRQPSGHEDLLLLESRSLDVRLALDLACRLASTPDEGDPDWAALPVPDLDALLLLVRRGVFGDRVRGVSRCPDDRCGASVEVGFEIGDYLAHHRPRTPRGAEADTEPGWFRVAGGTVRLRVPTVADLLAADRAGLPERALATACLRPAGLSSELRRKAERALEALAPSLVAEIAGACPECASPIAVEFDPLRYVLRELRDQAVYLFEEVHALGVAYHWTEAHILELPRSRRRRYAELAQSGSGAG